MVSIEPTSIGQVLTTGARGICPAIIVAVRNAMQFVLQDFHRRCFSRRQRQRGGRRRRRWQQRQTRQVNDMDGCADQTLPYPYLAVPTQYAWPMTRHHLPFVPLLAIPCTFKTVRTHSILRQVASLRICQRNAGATTWQGRSR